MRSPLVSLLLKLLGTVGLAAGFVVLVGRVPFMPQPMTPEAVSEPALADRPASRPAAGGFSATPPAAPDAPVTVTGDMGKALGFFRGQFATTGSSPGFTTGEYPVPGLCEGAGRRYLETECPGCEIIAGNSAGFSPSMLIWLDPASQARAVHAVSRDCIGVGADGIPVVGALIMNDPALDLTADDSALARDVVPLLPGATRVAAIEMGGWLAVFDHVARPSSALPDMAAALAAEGWRETADPEAGGLPSFAGERVFTKSADVFCVISLSKQGADYQLLTVVSSGARG